MFAAKSTGFNLAYVFPGLIAWPALIRNYYDLYSVETNIN